MNIERHSSSVPPTNIKPPVSSSPPSGSSFEEKLQKNMRNNDFLEQKTDMSYNASKLDPSHDLNEYPEAELDLETIPNEFLLEETQETSEEIAGLSFELMFNPENLIQGRPGVKSGEALSSLISKSSFQIDQELLGELFPDSWETEVGKIQNELTKEQTEKKGMVSPVGFEEEPALKSTVLASSLNKVPSKKERLKETEEMNELSEIQDDVAPPSKVSTEKPFLTRVESFVAEPQKLSELEQKLSLTSLNARQDAPLNPENMPNATFGDILEGEGEVSAQEVGGKIKMMLNQDKTRLVMKLNPEHLGKLNITIQKEEKTLRISIVASSESAKKSLESQMQILQETLESQGIEANKIDVRVEQEEKGTFFAFSEQDGSKQDGQGPSLGSSKAVSDLGDNQPEETKQQKSEASDRLLSIHV